MKHKSPFILLALGWLLLSLTVAFSQPPTGERNYSKAGGLKLIDGGFGIFGVAPHVNQDPTFSNYVPYYAKFALWVGTTDAKGEIRVTAGTGNAETPQPEWSPDTLMVDENSSLQPVQKVIATTFSDAAPFEGHQPLSLSVTQQQYGLRNAGFAVIVFTISLAENAPSLSNVYLGLFADIDATNDNALTSTDDNLGFAAKGTAPFIFDSKTEGDESPLLGAKILGTNKPIVSWWPAESQPKSDAEQYSHLKGEAATKAPTKSDDYQFLLSYGPIDLQPGESVQFPVAVAQASQLSDFENSLNDAEEFYAEELDGTGLKKTSAASFLQAEISGAIPDQFSLDQNFPNPFNPDTRIRFALPEAAHVQIRIYNTLGQRVKTLVDAAYRAGLFEVSWDSKDDSGQPVPSGVYYYQIKAGDFQAQRKLLLLK
jgi:hypothetical protein